MTMMAKDGRFFSSFSKTENITIKMTLVDFVIVYNDTVMNSKLQFEQPISKALEIPEIATTLTYFAHGSSTLG